MLDDVAMEGHESFGLLQIHRVSGGRESLFGSSVLHHERILLSVKRARRCRDLSRYWYSEGSPLVEVEMSPVQFAEAITSMNMGGGVPCTLKYVGRARMSACPATEQREIFSQEFESKIHSIYANMQEAIKAAEEVLDKKTLTKADKETVRQHLRRAAQEADCNLSFAQRQFDEAMEQTTLEAKGEVEGFILRRTIELGVGSLRQLAGNAKSVEPPVLELGEEK